LIRSNIYLQFKEITNENCMCNIRINGMLFCQNPIKKALAKQLIYIARTVISCCLNTEKEVRALYLNALRNVLVKTLPKRLVLVRNVIRCLPEIA
jgi:hypothetical protein